MFAFTGTPEREFFIDNLLVRIHFIIVMIRWTGLAPWDFKFPFPGSLTSTFIMYREMVTLPQSSGAVYPHITSQIGMFAFTGECVCERERASVCVCMCV